MSTSDIKYSHDPREIIRGLQQMLISDAKRIGFLFGAGTSMAVISRDSKESLIPGIEMMTTQIIESITDVKQKCAIDEISNELKVEGVKCQIENILSQVEQKARVIGNGELCGLKKGGFEDLKTAIENKIIEIVSVHKGTDFDIVDLIHSEFALWIHQASRKIPIEIYTTNYDYLIEIGLECYNVPYFDGFIGSYKPFFDPSVTEDTSLLPKWTKLWKLHGSLGWEYDDDCG
ncbi:MAG: hypothetical protein FIA99_14210 [Ruminiclostridium sp.]|nr:hypothetical protein [Ruminiclostridium sp.]